MKKYLITPLIFILAIFGLGACSSDADVASKNLAKEAENFEVFSKGYSTEGHAKKAAQRAKHLLMTAPIEVRERRH